MQPNEFWDLSPQEWWWEFDFKFRSQKAVKDQMARSSGKPTEAEWAEARKLHKEKMKLLNDRR